MKSSSTEAAQKRYPLISVLITLAMLVVILLSLATGVGLGYAIIFGILHAFDRSRGRQALHGAPAQAASSGSGD